jgi:hypothetical protein
MKSVFFPLHPILMAAVLICLLGGCQSSRQAARGYIKGGTDPNDRNFYADPTRIDAVKRVALMPVHAPTTGLANEPEIDQQFISKLTATRLFEVVAVPRDDLARRFGQRSFSSAGILTDTLFEFASETTAADAVFIFDLTIYQPYQPIKIGIRGKLISLEDQSILWAVDELIDASRTQVSRDAQRYEKRKLTQLKTTRHHDSILISPNRFLSYAVEHCLLTLPENSLNQNF